MGPALDAAAAAFIAQFLMHLISWITHIAFYGEFTARFDGHASPADNHLGWLVLVVPVIGGVIVAWAI